MQNGSTHSSSTSLLHCHVTGRCLDVCVVPLPPAGAYLSPGCLGACIAFWSEELAIASACRSSNVQRRRTADDRASGGGPAEPRQEAAFRHRERAVGHVVARPHHLPPANAKHARTTNDTRGKSYAPCPCVRERKRMMNGIYTCRW
jgi:hypothetical protein